MPAAAVLGEYLAGTRRVVLVCCVGRTSRLLRVLGGWARGSARGGGDGDTGIGMVGVKD